MKTGRTVQNSRDFQIVIEDIEIGAITQRGNRVRTENKSQFEC
jgi:hypothetical protein